MTTTWTPFMSAYEPESRSDGSIDPLGLQADAGRLADLLLPGFTVRVDRLRALTIATLISQLARQLSQERPIPHRLCLERVFLSALVSRTDSTLDPAVRGFPGRQKARTAIQQRQSLTLDRYVKGPATNGLVGVYWSLARSAALFDDDAVLRSRGDNVVSAWEHENDQVGLVSDPTRDVTGLRKRLAKIVRADLEDGVFDASVVRDLLFDIARFDKAGKGERRALNDALDDERAQPRRQVLALLRRELSGYKSWSSGDAEADAAEQMWRGAFERSIVRRWQALDGSPADDSIARASRMVIAYERVSLLLTAAFDAMRWLAGRAAGNPIGIDDVADNAYTLRVLKAVLDPLPAALDELETRRVALAEHASGFESWSRRPAELATSIGRLVEAFRGTRTPRDLLQAVVARHGHVQKAKRKGPWMLMDGTKYRFLGVYQLVAEAPRLPSDDFLHAFRIVNALSMLSDLEG